MKDFIRKPLVKGALFGSLIGLSLPFADKKYTKHDLKDYNLDGALEYYVEVKRGFFTTNTYLFLSNNHNCSFKFREDGKVEPSSYVTYDMLPITKTNLKKLIDGENFSSKKQK